MMDIWLLDKSPNTSSWGDGWLYPSLLLGLFVLETSNDWKHLGLYGINRITGEAILLKEKKT